MQSEFAEEITPKRSLVCENPPAIGKILISCVMDIFLSKTVKAKLFTGENLKSSTSTRMIIDLFAALIINYCVLLESPLVIKKKTTKN